MYKYTQLADQSPLFAEIHQSGPMARVEVVYPKSKEADQMGAHMNMHIVGSLWMLFSNLFPMPKNTNYHMRLHVAITIQ